MNQQMDRQAETINQLNYQIQNLNEIIQGYEEQILRYKKNDLNIVDLGKQNELHF